MMNRPNRNTIEKLLSLVEPVTESGCWIYHGCVSPNGYAYARFEGKPVSVHRLLYTRFVGQIPLDLQIDHLCRVKCCVNPAHLEAVTSQENTLRGIGPSAMNAKKTHCPRGHELIGNNVYLRLGRMRNCVLCRNLQNKMRRAKRKAEYRAIVKRGRV